jgi:hypothetical protein
MSRIEARYSSLKLIDNLIPLDADYVADNVIDFRDSKCGTIQITRTGGDQNDGEFSLKVSLLCDPSTFFCYPDSVLKDCDESNLGWIFQKIPFRYAQINYKKGTDTTGSFDIYATGKK